MDASKSVTQKVLEIFEEIAGPRAAELRPGVPARRSNDILGEALAGWHDDLVADEIAFHLCDWNWEAAFLVALHLFPERFTPEELREGTDLLLLDVPAHVIAAARLGGYRTEDIFNDESDAT